MKIIYISASNMLSAAGAQSTSYRLCEIIQDEILSRREDTCHTIIELKKHEILPCIGCGKCHDTHRCVMATILISSTPGSLPAMPL